MLSCNSLRQTVQTHRASVHQAVKLVAALLRVARVTAGLAESNGSLPPGLWLTSPAGWLPRTVISFGTLPSVIKYGLPFTVDHEFTCMYNVSRITWLNTVQRDLRAYSLTLNEAVDLAQNHSLWRLMYCLRMEKMCMSAVWANLGRVRGIPHYSFSWIISQVIMTIMQAFIRCTQSAVTKWIGGASSH